MLGVGCPQQSNRIEHVYAFDDVGRELKPEEFAQPYDVLSAA